MDDDSKLLGSELQASREGRRPKLTQPDVADALSVSRTTIQNIEAGKFKKINATIRDYARLLGWPDGAVDHVQAGGRLADLPVGTAPASVTEAAPLLGLSPAVEFELRSHETLDSTVINLGPDEADGHIVVILQGRKGASPEEIERVAGRYRRARRYLQAVTTAVEADEVADS
ncbi:helix-turn-helix transcriptional regulator [Streptomyces phaeochromogenes]|uniref:helix-turn-helix domain-containing protein n=1 Tax=Streptomyces phaeochromogenes TaxID=1923 RepID=UPI002DDB4C72|nr:helix-turn-helix transcriptional regulator [Streptomyces phaeochromogenes]WRZ30236.1 helix-turn-helix domain-containing protein [Streptomyces phaeochromogenes]